MRTLESIIYKRFFKGKTFFFIKDFIAWAHVPYWLSEEVMYITHMMESLYLPK